MKDKKINKNDIKNKFLNCFISYLRRFRTQYDIYMYKINYFEVEKLIISIGLISPSDVKSSSKDKSVN